MCQFYFLIFGFNKSCGLLLATVIYKKAWYYSDKYIKISFTSFNMIYDSYYEDAGIIKVMHPCPCGYFTDPRKACRCNTTKIANYMGKISGPLIDRIDIHLEIPAIKYKDLTDTKDAEASSAIKVRVEKARAIQRERFSAKMLGGSATICGGNEERVFYNARMNTRLIKKYCALNDEAKELLRMAMNELGLSARAYDKVLKVSRTIADLAGLENILAEHISEAIQYRSLDRQW